MHKKAIQACYALGRLDDAKPHKAALRKIRAATPEDKRPRDYCFDQFDAGKYRVLAYETFDTSGDLVYHLVFRVYDKRDELVRTVAVIDEQNILPNLHQLQANPQTYQVYLDYVGDSAHAVRGIDLSTGAASIRY